MMCRIVWTVSTVTPTVSWKPHCQFMSMWACPAQMIVYSFAAAWTGESISSARATMSGVTMPSCSFAASSTKASVSRITSSKTPPRSCESRAA